mmetsp:Transcript_55194/g.125540  ORF Transcript_55194/g.125540 Transcript_55194/m.125540 type:complete len:221 (-) Transcript_55194:118-780(-)
MLERSCSIQLIQGDIQSDSFQVPQVLLPHLVPLLSDAATAVRNQRGDPLVGGRDLLVVHCFRLHLFEGLRNGENCSWDCASPTEALGIPPGAHVKKSVSPGFYLLRPRQIHASPESMILRCCSTVGRRFLGIGWAFTDGDISPAGFLVHRDHDGDTAGRLRCIAERESFVGFRCSEMNGIGIRSHPRHPGSPLRASLLVQVLVLPQQLLCIPEIPTMLLL